MVIWFTLVATKHHILQTKPEEAWDPNGINSTILSPNPEQEWKAISTYWEEKKI